MEESLKKLCESLELNKETLAYFENGKIIKKEFSQSDNRYLIILGLENAIPANVYFNFYYKLSKALQEDNKNNKVVLKIELVNECNDLSIIRSYIETYIVKKEGNNEYFMFIKDSPLRLSNSKVMINFTSALMEDTLNALARRINAFLDAVGLKKKLVFNYEEPDNNIFDFEDDIRNYEENVIIYNELIKKQEEDKKLVSNTITVNGKTFTKKPAFKGRKYVRVELDDIPENASDIEFEAKVFSVEAEGKSNKRFKINVTNFKTSYTIHAFVNKMHSADDYLSLKGKWIIAKGILSYNQFDKEESIDLYNYELSNRVDEEVKDEAEVKRVELHAHTNMSAMDGICDVKDLVNLAAHFGHKAVAITDHNAVQSFPGAQSAQAELAKKGIDIKILYGIEINSAPRALDNVKNPSDISLKEANYVFFDLETSGLSSKFDEIIEFGAVKVSKGVIVDRIDLLIKPSIPVGDITINLTHIDNDMLKDKKSIKENLPIIKEFLGDNILVAHNASFDIGFLESAFGYELSNPCIDTLPLCRYLFPNEKRYTLGSLCRAHGIDYDEESAHRGDYDAEVLEELYVSLILPELNERKIDKHSMLESLQSNEVTRKMHPYHTNILVKNKEGLKNLFKILSIANTKYLTDFTLAPFSVINENREGLLIGSSCARGEIFEIASTKNEKSLEKAMEWYDYIEIQPLDQYQILVDTEKISSIDRVKEIIKFIIDVANKLGKPICATGDSHYLHKDEAIAREVFISTPAIGGGYHPLFDYKHRIKQYPIQEFKTTKQMLDAFSWLGEDKAFEYVISNPNKIADEIEVVLPCKDKLYPPKIEGSDDKLRAKCHEIAKKMYGDPLPDIVKNRLEYELKCIINNGYSIMYLIASLCVINSNEQGYIVGSRGSVGSSFAATCAGITEVNALKPHYRCPNCCYSDFSVDDKKYRSGFDLPSKKCPKCGANLIGDGHSISFATFLGFDGDKVPDIDLNFSALNQANAHAFIKEMFGADHVFRAGTIATAASKTAFGYAKKHFENMGVEIRNAEAARIACLCEGVKRTTGQHPGGLIVIPNDMDVYDFTPVGYPADDVEADWMTTHLDFHSIHDNVLKLDMLGHVDPTVIRMLQNLTGIKPQDIPLNDPDVIAMFNGDEFMDNPKLTSIGLPEFGTPTARRMLVETKPTSFADLTKISGLAHGTDVYFGNIRDLIVNGTCNIVNCIGCRDDVMAILQSYGIEDLRSFKIMEAVRKGKQLTSDDITLLKEHDVPQWFIDACMKIKYLFPKAHAVAYCLMAVRIAYFKLYYPLEFYASYFTYRSDAYDIEAMINGISLIKSRYLEIKSKQNSNIKITKKEEDLFTFYEVCIEMYQRGYKFENVNLEKSLDNDFVINKENNSLIPPFKVCDKIGPAAAISVVEGRKKGPYLSKSDLRSRTKLNDSNIKLLQQLGVLDQLNETSQLTLF